MWVRSRSRPRRRCTTAAGPSSGPRAQAAGYVLAGSGGEAVYFAGDTDLYPGMATLPGVRDGVDVALLPVWGWGPVLGPGHLDPARAVEAATLIRPRHAMPIHAGTYYPAGLRRVYPRNIVEPPGDFARGVSARGLSTDVLVPRPGSVLVPERSPERSSAAPQRSPQRSPERGGGATAARPAPRLRPGCRRSPGVQRLRRGFGRPEQTGGRRGPRKPAAGVHAPARLAAHGRRSVRRTGTPDARQRHQDRLQAVRQRPGSDHGDGRQRGHEPVDGGSARRTRPALPRHDLRQSRGRVLHGEPGASR